VSGGAVRVSLDQSALEITPGRITLAAPAGDDGLSTALGIVLDGIATRHRS
jgi:hypothetical protein